MQTHRMQVVIPEDHRLVVEVPETFHAGPAQLILVAPAQSQELKVTDPEALARWDSVLNQLAADGRPFHSLSAEEKLERHRLLRGIGKGILPSSEEVARSKREEAILEDSKLGW